MRVRRDLFAYIIFILIGIGIVYQLFRGNKTLIIGFVVLGIIFLLYKFPPNRWGSRRYVRRSRKRKHHFRVIDGKKNNDDPPPFH